MESCLYEGRVEHARTHPVEHRFSFPLFLVYLDLAELDRVFRGRWLWSTRRPALAWFRRADHLGDPRLPLERAVRDLVEARSGRRPGGPIRLLTHLRYFGYVFNPLSVYYCFAPGGDRLEAVVADVTNTPWNERHAYVLRAEPEDEGPLLRARTAKTFHVSPFLGMDHEYRWRVGLPGERLQLSIENHERGGGRPFRASVALERREITGPALARVLVRHPLMTAQVVAGIYAQAFRLRRKGAPYHAHPQPRRGGTPKEATG